MNPANRHWWNLFDFAVTKKTWLLITICVHYSFTFSQTTNISGVINSYYNVLGVNTAAVKLDNTTGLAYGNTVLIIQMKGATINPVNNSSFGDTMSLNYAGNYELATICSVSSDSVYFFNTILNSYDVSSKVQLVKFGEYYSANVTDTVKAQSWNNSTGKGGVLAIKVEEDLTLNAPLFADSTGYKGGAFYLHNSNCNFFNPVGNGFAYDATSASEQNGAYKGEGVADVPSTLDGARGAPANGGGGGNNHNNGGGGGANLTAGGNGGGNFSTGPSGCTGNFQGRGGKPLQTWSNRKIFAGGGGGAGHANNTVQPYGGGNGGGIIIVLAKNIIGNGYKISANGQTGRSTSYDGASGGGAGGTIIMNVINSYSGTLTIQANGGNGGNEDDDNSLNRCYGSGGGGSGGVIYFNSSLPSVTRSFTGGLAGTNIQSNGCGIPILAANGTTGSEAANYSYRTSINPSSSCASSLPVRIIYFDARFITDKNITLAWDVADPEQANTFTIEKLNSANEWIELTTLDAKETLHHYETPDVSAGPGENIYRLRVDGKNNSIVYSVQKRVFIKYNDRYTVYPNPAKNKITIKGKLDAGTLIVLTDISGKVINEKRISSTVISPEIILPAVPPGIYFIKVENDVMKIVIR